MPTLAPSGATVTGAPPPLSAPPEMPTQARYELGTEIARGGMGRVVEATDTLLGRTVAIKQVLSNDADTLKRFARETRITARLEHPAIVPVHDAGGLDDGGVPYYVMRKIGGRPLERLVAHATDLDARLVLVPHIVTAAQAIAHAHERGVVHRDIKPSNILVGELGETIVIDWGLAKAKAEPDDPIDPTLAQPQVIDSGAGGQRSIDDRDGIKTRAGIVYGTPGFMAPEQLRGKPVDERCDVYALGATLYHLLYRKPPHYATDPSKMMLDAAHRPATPIAQVVPAVPRELATIVDKALAYHREDRYPDARELARDLQRYLDGQLVGSHRYSPRERLVRFIRKHRAAVGIGVVAGVALAVVGSVSVARVVAARDREAEAARQATRARIAAEAQRDLAERRTEDLTLAQARHEVLTNPTRAVAMVAPLVTERWREVRSIANAARIQGLAWRLPASKHTTSLELSPDGTQALAVGDDGVLRTYDLGTRALTEIAKLAVGTRARWADAGRRIVAWHEATLVVIELATGGRRTIDAAAPIVDIAAIGQTLHWVDARGALWRLELSGTEPIQRPLDEPVHRISAQPGGTQLALAGSEHLLLFDDAQPAAPAQIVVNGRATALDWSGDGSRLGALLDERMAIEVAAYPNGFQLVMRDEVGARTHLAASRDGVLAGGPVGAGIVGRGMASERAQLTGGTVGAEEALGDVLLAAGPESIVVMGPDGDRTLVPPAGRLERLAASASGTFVVAAIEDGVLLWNLADIRPQSLAKWPPASAHFAGSKHLVVADEGVTYWRDLDGATQELGPWSSVLEVAATPDERTVCVIDGAHQAHVARAGGTAVDVGPADHAGFVSAFELVLATSDRIDLVDVRTNQRRTLVDGPLRAISFAGAWVAVAFIDGTLWRMNVADGTTAQTTLAADALIVGPEGTVVAARGTAISRWTSIVVPVGSTTTPVVALAEAGAATILAVSADGQTALVTAEGIRESMPVLARSIAGPTHVSPATGQLVEERGGGIELVDVLAQHRWSLARAPQLGGRSRGGPAAIAYSYAAIAPDGQTVIAQGPRSFVAWRLNQPADPTATQRWLATLTNATLDPSAGASGAALRWR